MPMFVDTRLPAETATDADSAGGCAAASCSCRGCRHHRGRVELGQILHRELNRWDGSRIDGLRDLGWRYMTVPPLAVLCHCKRSGWRRDYMVNLQLELGIRRPTREDGATWPRTVAGSRGLGRGNHSPRQ